MIGRTRVLLAAVAVVAALAAAIGALSRVQPAVSATAANPTAAENARPGDSYWTAWKNPAPASVIEGYASQSSIAPGETLRLFVNSPSSSYRLEIDRLGWYGGAGGRRLACRPSCTESKPPVAQTAAPLVDPVTHKLDANWELTNTVAIGSGWPSGYYLAVFRVTSGPYTGKSAWYPFVVTPPAGSSGAILVQVPTNTWQAYNNWPGGETGHSLYGSNSAGSVAATKVSFNRPLMQAGGGNYTQSAVFGREIQAVRFLEREGLDISYVADQDVDREPGVLLNHRLDVVLGHDEYWTMPMREAWAGALAAGHNEVFLGADIGTWVVRYEDSRRTLVGYKSSLDPGTPQTILFRKLTPPMPECELEGVQYNDHAHHPGRRDYTVTGAAAHNPWLVAAGLKSGNTVTASVGYEWDQITAGCSTPALEVLFHFQGVEGESNADAVTFRVPGGGTVFSSGSNQFANMLDSYNDATSRGQTADPRIQAFMRSLIAGLSG